MEVAELLKQMKDRKVGVTILTVDDSIIINMHCTANGEINQDMQILPDEMLDSLNNEVGNLSINRLIETMMNQVSKSPIKPPVEYKSRMRGFRVKEDSIIRFIKKDGVDVTNVYITDSTKAINAGMQIHFKTEGTYLIIIEYGGELEPFL